MRLQKGCTGSAQELAWMLRPSCLHFTVALYPGKPRRLGHSHQMNRCVGLVIGLLAAAQEQCEKQMGFLPLMNVLKLRRKDQD